MNDQESIRDYYTRIQMLVNSMKTCGEKLLDQQIVDKILRTLTLNLTILWWQLRSQRMQMEELQNSHEAHEQRLLERINMRVATQALHAQAFQRNDGRGSMNKKRKWKNKLKDSNEGSKNSSGNNYKKNEGHGKFSKKGGNQNKGWQTKFDKRNIQCYACKKWGHFAYEFYDNKGKQKKEDETQMVQDIVEDQNWLWYLRFGHLNFGSLGLLKKKGMVHGFPSIEPPKELSEGFLISKQTKSSFKSNIPTTKTLIEVVYSYVYSSMESVSLRGNHYFISFIDEFSRKLWVYLIKRKGEAFEVFKRFKAMLRNSVAGPAKSLE
ncbi:hypothetical protein CR513_42614, partial [Mucuna pruriens]